MKLAILSFAHTHAEVYIDLLHHYAGVELVGISDDDELRGKSFAEKYGVRFFSDYEDLLLEKPDGIIVCSETAKHRKQVEQAAQKGIHVLCEKPIASNLIDAKAMIEACESHHVILMMAYPLRFSVPFNEIKTDYEMGKYGKVFALNTTNQAQIPIMEREWFGDKLLAGGGAVMDHTVHLADALRWILQDEVQEVYAQHNRILFKSRVSVETAGLIMITFTNGVFASIDCSWSKPINYPTWGGVTIDMITENGAVSIDAYKQSLDLYQYQQSSHKWDYWGSSTKKPLLDEFIDAIHGHRKPCITGMDGYKSLEIALAAYQSTKLNQVIKLPLSD
jgi:predicted dehydrogenase